MRIAVRLLLCALLPSAAMTVHAVQLPPAPALTEAQIAAKCKAASFARNPPGQLSKTMREMAIERCIKNKGFLD
jgi:hypothetical protein